MLLIPLVSWGSKTELKTLLMFHFLGLLTLGDKKNSSCNRPKHVSSSKSDWPVTVDSGQPLGSLETSHQTVWLLGSLSLLPSSTTLQSFEVKNILTRLARPFLTCSCQSPYLLLLKEALKLQSDQACSIQTVCHAHYAIIPEYPSPTLYPVQPHSSFRSHCRPYLF